MAQAPADIGSMVFRPAILENTGAFSLNGQMLAVFIEFDGSRTVAEIAKRLNLELAAITKAVRRLSELGLVEPVTDVAQTLAPAIIDHVTQQLAIAVGPLAVVLVEDEIQDLGYQPESFPMVRLGELVDRLSGNIRKEDKKHAFLAAMAELVQSD
jgi:hypothetical protein